MSAEAGSSQPDAQERAGLRHAACTIVARNYIGFARVLEDSFVATNPSIDFLTLVIDGSEEDRSDSRLSNVLLVEDLGLSPDVIEPMLVMYGVTELATALKPALLQHVLRQGYSATAYLDPDIWVCDDLTEVFEQAAESGIVLTPHTLAALPRDGLEIREQVIMRAGIFNLGFIAVGSGAGDFLSWWHERLRTDAVIDFENGLFTDQRWIDWVPALFPAVVSRDPGLNVAYWNLHERPLSRAEDDRLLAAGAPLRFVHFSGFDISNPWVLSRFTGENPRVLVSDDVLLQELSERYAKALTEAEHLTRRALPYGYGRLPGGPVLSPAVRRVYRDSVVGLLPFPGAPTRPWTEPEAFREWLNHGVWTSPWSRLAPVEYALWRGRPDLRAGFPSPFGAFALTFRRWLDDEPSVADHYRQLEIDPPVPDDGGPPDEGWSVVVGGHPGPSGQVRAIAERIAADLARTGAPVALHSPRDGGDGCSSTWTRTDLSGDGYHANRIVCIDADHFTADRLVQMVGEPHGPCIGVWLSSEPVVDPEGRAALELFDEVWVLTPGAEAAVRGCVPRPVHQIYAPPVEDPDVVRRTDTAGRAVVDSIRSTGPVVLLELDACGDCDSQNAAGAIEAYRSAFAEPDGARLLVDVRYREPSRRQVDVLRHVIGGRSDVVVLTESTRPEGVGSLVPEVDAVLGLYCADTVGLPVLAAIEAGVPVVATRFAAALSGLDGDDARVVPCTVEERPGQRPSVWAHPDIDAAVEQLRAVWLEREEATSTATQALAALRTSAETVRDRVSAPRGGGNRPDKDRVAAASLRRTLVSDHEGLGRVRGLRAQVARLEAELAGVRRTRWGTYARRLRNAVTSRR